MSKALIEEEVARPAEARACAWRPDEDGAVCPLEKRLDAEIAERKRVERELACARRLESVGQMASGIAHEINTPSQYLGDNLRFLEQGFAGLAALDNMFARLLEAARKAAFAEDLIAEIDAVQLQVDADYVAEEVPKAIRQSLQGVRQIAHIVSAIRAFSNTHAEHRTATDVNQVVANTLTVCRPAWKHVAIVLSDLAPDLPLVPCIPGEINEVILNLVLNAAQAVVDVVGDKPSVKGRITVRTRARGDGVEIRVEDSGAGVPEQIRDKVFDPFCTTRKPGEGIGLGLAIAHAIVVKKHGGTIELESTPGHGTTFTVWLPGSEGMSTK